MPSILTLAQLAVASDAFDRCQKGKEKVGMDSVTVSAFFEELEKMGADLAAEARDEKDKEANYDPVGEARGFKHVIEQVHAAKKARMAAAATVPAKSMVTRTMKAVSHAANPTGNVASTAVKAPGARGGLRKSLAIGGAVLGAGTIGHMLPHHDQQQPQQMHY